jgi:hypothetical protein
MESVSKVVDHGTKGTIEGFSTVSVFIFPEPAHPLSRRTQKMSPAVFLSMVGSYLCCEEKGLQIIDFMMDD